MNNNELKKKIVEIIINAIWKDAEADYDSTDETEAGSIADALIAAGIGDVNKFADTLASKIHCHSYYYGDSIVCAIYALKQGREIKDVKPVNISEFLVDELRRKLKEAEHRAEVAEKMFGILHEESSMYMKVFSKEWYKQQAEKELAEGKEENNAKNQRE